MPSIVDINDKFFKNPNSLQYREILVIIFLKNYAELLLWKRKNLIIVHTQQPNNSGEGGRGWAGLGFVTNLAKTWLLLSRIHT